MVEVMVNTWPTSRWLSEQITMVNGINAQVSFPFPDNHLRKFVNLFLGSEFIEDDRWRINQLVWEIIDVLPELLKKDEAKDIYQWLNDETDQSKGLNKKQWELANKIADTFSKYILYRPNLISEWLKFDINSDHPLKIQKAQFKWQPVLIRLLKERIKSDPINIQINKVIKRLKNGDHPEKALPSQLNIFGVSSLAPIQIDLIQALSSIIDVKIFLLSPCEDLWKRCRDRREALGEHWKEASTDTWLLKAPRLEANLGRMGAEFQQLLEGIGENQLGEIKEEDFFAKPSKIAKNKLKDPTLLEQLQESLLSPDSIEKLNRSKSDNSLIFIASPGLRRQVQIVRDQLIQWFAQDDTLQPKDVIIMTPQIEKLAPLINSIFNDISSTKINLPLRITDRSQTNKPRSIQTILEMLEIASTRLTALNLETLLAGDLLSYQFCLEQEEVEKITYCLQETGFRWGIDSRDRNGDHTHTLDWCLERWLLGLVLPSESGLALQGVAPFSKSYSVAEITKWWSILSQICRYLQEFRLSRDCVTWASFLKLIHTELFKVDDQWSWESQMFHSGIDSWVKIASDCKLKIEPSVLKDILAQLFSLESGRFGHRSGAITCSALEPMRAIPHRVIVLMGLDESVFPYKEEIPSFNMMEQKRLLGDPKSNEKDRYVLLEALMSAREKLLITWNARDEKTGESLEAPDPIHQWIEYLRNELDESCFTGLTKYPPSNPLSYKNFQPSECTPPISCDELNLEAKLWLNKNVIQKSSGISVPLKWSEDIQSDSKNTNNDLVKNWLKAPQLIWLEQHNLSPKEKDISVESLETFELNELQRFKLITNHLIDKNNSLNTSSEYKDWVKSLEGQGILPPKPFATLESRILNERWSNLCGLMKDIGVIEESKLALKNENINLLIAGNTNLIIDVGKLKASSLMTSWLKHLQVCVYDKTPRHTILIHRSSSRSKQNQYEKSIELKPIPKSKAKVILDGIISTANEGLVTCWPIPPISGLELAKARYKEKSNPNAYFMKAWKGSYNIQGERAKHEMRICFGNNSDPGLFLGNEVFERCMRNLYTPLLENLYKKEDK